MLKSSVLKQVVNIATAGFKRLFHLSGMTEEDHEEPQSRQPGF
jgi:hypothetical protein